MYALTPDRDVTNHTQTPRSISSLQLLTPPSHTTHYRSLPVHSVHSQKYPLHSAPAHPKTTQLSSTDGHNPLVITNIRQSDQDPFSVIKGGFTSEKYFVTEIFVIERVIYCLRIVIAIATETHS